MKLEHNWCYTALKSRDERFDGRFFTGVLTTGIYCRPICPATTPRSENTKFYPSAAAAEEAGFRPCLRCRPESSPGTPEWMGSSSIVSRALRLISEGVLDDYGINGLTERLHVGRRHLRRLFVEYVGAPPMAVAQNRRIGFAKKLIDETGLPMSEIAYCSGFGSIRRFNDAFQKMYGKPPTALRRKGKPMESAKDKPSNLHLKLFYRPPFDYDSILQFLAFRAIPGVESVEGSTYRRSIVIAEDAGILEVSFGKGKNYLEITIPQEFSRSLIQIVEKVRQLFDLKADPAAIKSELLKDKKMARLVAKYPGLRVPGAWDGFEIGVRAILGQQVSVKAARTLCGRLVERFGKPLESSTEGDIQFLFPYPEDLAEADMSGMGLVGSRAEAIRNLAKAVSEGTVSLGPSFDYVETISALCALPGIGSWTAQYIAMRALGETDAFPSGDLGLLKAMEAIEGKSVKEKELIKMAETWRPWRAYATMYLWKSLG